MGYTAGFLKDRVTILNRKESEPSAWGKDGGGVEFEPAMCTWANVDWARGKRGMNVGALDVYAVVIVRMRWNPVVNERSRIVHDGKTYQVLGETFHADKRGNAIQFQAQLLINDK